MRGTSKGLDYSWDKIKLLRLLAQKPRHGSDHLLIILQWIQKLLAAVDKVRRRQLFYTIITTINAILAFYHSKNKNTLKRILFIACVCMLCIFQKGKTQVQFLRLGTLGFPIEFKHIVALTNKTQTMLSFPRKFKFNIFEFNQEPNVLDLRNCT